MAKSGNLEDARTKFGINSVDKERAKIVLEEIKRFKKLIKGHEKLLAAIGELWDLLENNLRF